jgi:hypothetical protein
MLPTRQSRMKHITTFTSMLVDIAIASTKACRLSPSKYNVLNQPDVESFDCPAGSWTV